MTALYFQPRRRALRYSWNKDEVLFLNVFITKHLSMKNIFQKEKRKKKKEKRKEKRKKKKNNTLALKEYICKCQGLQSNSF
jgi:hypothetical protein